MTPIKTLYLARDTESICLFENKPVRDVSENGFSFIDTKSKWFSKLTDPNIKIEIGEIIELPLINKVFFEQALSELEFLRKMFTI